MIFSLGEIEKKIVIPDVPALDTFCFFKVENAVQMHESLWWPSICASLKRKHSVLILEPSIEHYPAWNERDRMASGDNWCWLTPRSLSVISDACSNNPSSFLDFKNFLIQFK